MATGLVLLSAGGCTYRDDSLATRPKASIQFRDVTPQTGIRFVHTDGSSGRRYIVEPMSAGLATFDYDGDGLIDIYFLNGAPMPGTHVDKAPRNALYRNLGNWRFEDVTEQAGVGDTGFGLGVTVGDYNNDGYPDLYLNNHGPNVLYRNNGDGTFTDVTEETGTGNGDLVGAGACFLDIDADGDLDLYAANYLRFNVEEHVPRMFRGFPSYPSPRDFLPVPDSLFRNNGDGTFTDISKSSGVAEVAGTGMGMVCADADDDGDTDVFVLNDVKENFYFENDGKGNFQEVGTIVGLAYNSLGMENASMGVDCGDIDNDGFLDFFMTSYQMEIPVYYHNLGNGMFEDITQRTQAGVSTFAYVNWGVGVVDMDNDGDLDIFIANGHTEDNVDQYDSSTSYKAPNTILEHLASGELVDSTLESGIGQEPAEASRGAAFDDLDNDGDIDCVIQNSRRPPSILENTSSHANHWIQLQLRGTRCNRDAVGSHVTVVAGDYRRLDEVHSGRGYQSHYGSRLHFGLGKHDRVDRIEIRWHGGGREVIENVAADQILTIVQGQTGRKQP